MTLETDTERVGSASASPTKFQPKKGSLALDVSYAGRVAFITGSSSGIGRALATALARSGCRVGLIARRKPLLDQIHAEIQADGGIAAVSPADVGDRSQIHRAFAELTAALGPADLLIASAGVGVPTTLEPMNIDTIEETIRVNVLGVIYAIEACLPSMLERGSGQIAAISSLSAYKGMPGESAYCASKAAVNSYLEGLRVQVRNRGIGVTTICPGFVKTPMTAIEDFPMLWPMEAEEAADRIIRALRKRVKVLNFPWQTTTLMQLARLMPDWVLARIFRHHLEHPPMLNPPSPTPRSIRQAGESP
jgi:short-subunit dehydrogenase